MIEMMPNNKKAPLTVDECRDLIARAGKSQRWISARTGISERRLRYLTAGGRMVAGVLVETFLSYPEQYCLEVLADAADVVALA